MQAEGFSDPAIGAQINDNFIPVLVDRDERPDIDQIYQAAAAIMGHAGGWPLNLFLMPDGVPYFVTGFWAAMPHPREAAASARRLPPSSPTWPPCSRTSPNSWPPPAAGSWTS